MKSSYLGKVYLKKGTPDSLTKFRKTKKKNKRRTVADFAEKRRENISKTFK